METGQRTGQRSMQEIITEVELLDLLQIKKDVLDRLRQTKQFPFCKISDRIRIYLVNDIVNYVEHHKTILNKGSD